MEWSPPSTIGMAPAAHTWPTIRRMASWLLAWSAGVTSASPKSTHREHIERIDPEIHVRARGRSVVVTQANGPRAESRSGPVAHGLVHGGPDDGHVDAAQVLGIEDQR